ncbi:T9SS type A sorting domain-containing protein [Porphyromonas gingivicanis]|nr:T9SS type A sorting domain-containing protein [Porphyromonas gingivicanis]
MRLKQLLITLSLLMGGIGAMQAQKSYDFRINDVLITEENVNQMHNIEGVSIGEGGHLTYAPETRTLSMKNVSLTLQGSSDCIRTRGENLFTLHLEGENVFTAPEGYGADFANTRITGPGKLTVKTRKHAIYIEYGTLTIANGCTVSLYSNDENDGWAGITGNRYSPTNLVVENASLHVKASGKADEPYPYAIGSLASITLDGVKILEPSEAKIDTYDYTYDGGNYTYTFVLLDGKPTTEVKIGKEAAVEYNFYINGVSITEENVNQMHNIKGVSIGDDGHLTYAPETRTLSMKNVSLTVQGSLDCIRTRGKNLFTLHLEGENVFTAPEGYGADFSDTRITGPGKLTVETRKFPIYIESGTLTIADGCTVSLYSNDENNSWGGIEGNRYYPTNLVVEDASLHVKASGKADKPYPYAIGTLASITLKGVKILEPSGAMIGTYDYRYNEGDHTHFFVLLNGEPTTEVKIGKDVAVEEVAATALTLYPNPADHKVHIEGAKAGLRIALYNIEGVRLLTAETNEAGKVELDLTSLPEGNYFVRAGNGQAYRLLVHR